MPLHAVEFRRRVCDLDLNLSPRVRTPRVCSKELSAQVNDWQASSAIGFSIAKLTAAEVRMEGKEVAEAWIVASPSGAKLRRGTVVMPATAKFEMLRENFATVNHDAYSMLGRPELNHSPSGASPVICPTDAK